MILYPFCHLVQDSWRHVPLLCSFHTPHGKSSCNPIVSIYKIYLESDNFSQPSHYHYHPNYHRTVFPLGYCCNHMVSAYLCGLYTTLQPECSLEANQIMALLCSKPFCGTAFSHRKSPSPNSAHVSPLFFKNTPCLHLLPSLFSNHTGIHDAAQIR